MFTLIIRLWEKRLLLGLKGLTVGFLAVAGGLRAYLDGAGGAAALLVVVNAVCHIAFYMVKGCFVFVFVIVHHGFKTPFYKLEAAILTMAQS